MNGLNNGDKDNSDNISDTSSEVTSADDNEAIESVPTPEAPEDTSTQTTRSHPSEPQSSESTLTTESSTTNEMKEKAHQKKKFSKVRTHVHHLSRGQSVSALNSTGDLKGSIIAVDTETAKPSQKRKETDSSPNKSMEQDTKLAKTVNG